MRLSSLFFPSLLESCADARVLAVVFAERADEEQLARGLASVQGFAAHACACVSSPARQERAAATAAAHGASVVRVEGADESSYRTACLLSCLGASPLPASCSRSTYALALEPDAILLLTPGELLPDASHTGVGEALRPAVAAALSLALAARSPAYSLGGPPALLRCDLPWRHVDGGWSTLASHTASAFGTIGTSPLGTRLENEGTTFAQENDRYARNAAHYQNLVDLDSNDATSLFFLAWSLVDGGRTGTALPLLARRAAMGSMHSGDEHPFLCHLQIGRIHGVAGRTSDATSSWLLAYEVGPSRAPEALTELAQLMRTSGRHPSAALTFAAAAAAAVRTTAPQPPLGALYASYAPYDYGADLELSLGAFEQLNNPMFQEGLLAATRLLSKASAPAHVRAAVTANARAYLAAATSQLAADIRRMQPHIDALRAALHPQPFLASPPPLLALHSDELHAREAALAARLAARWDDTADSEGAARAVAGMVLWAWEGYVRHAWGADELRPLSTAAHDWLRVGLTMVDSLDTLMLVGLSDHAIAARSWALNDLPALLEKDSATFGNVFETTIRMVGGLLAAAHVAPGGADAELLALAAAVAARLAPAFERSPTGVPVELINLASGRLRHQPWIPPDAFVAEAGTLTLEFREALTSASHLPGVNASALALASDAAVRALRTVAASCEGGLAQSPFISAQTGRPGQLRHVTLGGRVDSFYEYLFKAWLQSGKTDAPLLRAYQDAIHAVTTTLLVRAGSIALPGGEAQPVIFVKEILHGAPLHKMDHLVCFYPGLLALGVLHGVEPRAEQQAEQQAALQSLGLGAHATQLDVAEGVAAACRLMYDASPLHLGPESAYFESDGDGSRWRVRIADGACALASARVRMRGAFSFLASLSAPALLALREISIRQHTCLHIKRVRELPLAHLCIRQPTSAYVTPLVCVRALACPQLQGPLYGQPVRLCCFE